MVNIEEMMKRAQQASENASKQLNESMEKSRKIAEQNKADAEKAEAEKQLRKQEAEAQNAANQQRQVEILGQMFSPEFMAQMTDMEAMIQQKVNEKVEEVTALGLEGMMNQLLGEDMGVIAAALETLAMENEEDEETEPSDFDQALEEELYRVLDEKLAQIQSLPEPEPVLYTQDDPRWAKFGILLSGIISNLNDHQLDDMDVEEHIPVMEQQIASLVRRSWGIHGRSELLDTLRYLSQEGYTFRYQLFCDAVTAKVLTDEAEDEEEREALARAWRFAQHYKTQFSPSFMTGWDTGRAAMLTRWGCYLGWITEGEAIGMLRELSLRAAQELHSWREFAQSYLFGGLMWKLLCSDTSAECYLGFVADAAIDLLTGQAEDNEGQWRNCPWPARRYDFQA